MSTHARLWILTGLATAGLAGVAWASVFETVEISAPLFPKVLVMYQGQPPNYPTTLSGQQQLVDASALSFEFLLADCSTDGGYPIHLAPQDGGVLSQEQLASNYSLIADCAYLRYTAKPYWIPQLVIDVDICGRVVGPGWRLVSEADLLGFRASDFQYLQEVLAKTANGSSGMGSFYFSTRIYAAASDGGLVMGDLSPNATARVLPLPPTVCTQGQAPTAPSGRQSVVTFEAYFPPPV